MGIRHKFRSPISDDGIPEVEVKPSNWNDEHEADGYIGALMSLALAANSFAYLDDDRIPQLGLLTAAGRAILAGNTPADVLSYLGGTARDNASLTGAPTAPTPPMGDSSTRIATMEAVQVAIANLVSSSPSTLDTLNELATALGNDPNFSASVSAALGFRLRFDAAQALTAPQRAQVYSNLGFGTVVTYDVGAGAGQIVQLDGAGRLPSVDGSQLLGLPGNSRVVADRTILRGLASPAYLSATLIEAGRGGIFEFDGTDHAADVTADTNQGDFLAPAGQTGSLGAWVRQRKTGDLFKTSEYGGDIASAMAMCARRGGGVVEINTVGSIPLTHGLIKPANVEVVGLGEGKTVIVPMFGATTDFVKSAEWGPAYWVMATKDANGGAMIELPAFEAIGQDEIQATFLTPHGLKRADEFAFCNLADYSFCGARPYYRAGERHYVMEVIDDYTVIMDYGALDTYTYSGTMKAYKVPKWNGKFGGFTIDATEVDPALGSWGICKVFRAAGAIIDDIGAYGTDSSGIELDQCLGIRALRCRGASQLDGAADTTHYPLLICSSTDTVFVGATGRGIWCGGDISANDTPGGFQSYRSGYESCTIVGTGTSPAAGVHAASQDCFYDRCKIDGGACLGGLNFTLSQCDLRVRRGANSVVYYGSDMVGGRMNILDCNAYTGRNAQADAPTSHGALYVLSEQPALKSEIFLNVRGGSLYAPAEARPFHIEEGSTTAPISYSIQGLDCVLGSVNTDGLVYTLKKTGSPQASHAIIDDIRGFNQSRPWARWDNGYLPVKKKMPRESLLWNDVTAAAATNTQNSTITLPHGYPVGYPMSAVASLQTDNLGPKTNANIKAITSTTVTPMIGTGNDTNLSPSANFSVRVEYGG